MATPGRLLDHVQQRTIDLSKIEILVLDEADRMLDMGFIRDIRRILKLLPGRRQNLMFSATYSDDIRELASGLLHNPVSVEVERRNSAVETVTQQVHEIRKDDKRRLLSHLIRNSDWGQVLVFTRTKHGANRLTKQLEDDGINASAIHGNKSQSARTKALADFKGVESLRWSLQKWRPVVWTSTSWLAWLTTNYPMYRRTMCIGLAARAVLGPLALPSRWSRAKNGVC